MGATRQRFTPAERSALLIGADIEWRHGSRWYAGTVSGPITTDEIGAQYVPVTHTIKSPTVSPGGMRCYPKQIRVLAV